MPPKRRSSTRATAKNSSAKSSTVKKTAEQQQQQKVASAKAARASRISRASSAATEPADSVDEDTAPVRRSARLRATKSETDVIVKSSQRGKSRGRVSEPRTTKASEKKQAAVNVQTTRKRKRSDVDDEPAVPPPPRKTVKTTKAKKRSEPIAKDSTNKSDKAGVEAKAAVAKTRRSSRRSRPSEDPDTPATDNKPTAREAGPAAPAQAKRTTSRRQTPVTQQETQALGKDITSKPKTRSTHDTLLRASLERTVRGSPAPGPTPADVTPFSPTATEVLDFEGEDFMRTAQALGVKVRDFAHEPPKPNATPSPELLVSPFYLLLFLDVHYRRPWDEFYHLSGKNLRRLLDLGYVTEAEKEKYWTERDKRLLAQYDSKPKYPYIVCHPERPLPTRAFRIAMRKLAYGVKKNEIPDEEFDIPDGEWEGDEETIAHCEAASEGWPSALAQGGSVINANKWQAGTHFMLVNFPWAYEYGHGVDDEPFFGSKENPDPGPSTSQAMPEGEMERFLAAAYSMRGPRMRSPPLTPRASARDLTPTPTPSPSPEPPTLRRTPPLCRMRGLGAAPDLSPWRRGLGRNATLARIP